MLKIHVTRGPTTAKSMPICLHCSQVFRTMDEALVHTQLANTEGKIRVVRRSLSRVLCCEFCEEAYENRKSCIDHKNTHKNNGKPFKCSYCPANYDTFSKLRSHEKSHQAAVQYTYPIERRYICDNGNCLKSYMYWSDLSVHRKTAHLEKPTIFKCMECDGTFYSVWSFSYHKQSVHGMPYVCDVCDQTFSTVKSLKRHMGNFHKNPEKTAEITKHKKEVIMVTAEYDKHIQKTSDNPFYCKTCDKSLSSRVAARTHIRYLHIKLRKFKCKICNKNDFFVLRDVKDHMAQVCK